MIRSQHSISSVPGAVLVAQFSLRAISSLVGVDASSLVSSSVGEPQKHPFYALLARNPPRGVAWCGYSAGMPWLLPPILCRPVKIPLAPCGLRVEDSARKVSGF